MLRQTYVSLQLRLKEGIPCQWNSPPSCRDQFMLLKSNGPNNPSLIFTSKKQTGGLLSSHIFGLFKSLNKIADLTSNLFHRKILAVTLKSHKLYLEHFNVKVQSKDKSGIWLSFFCHWLAGWVWKIKPNIVLYHRYSPPPHTWQGLPVLRAK